MNPLAARLERAGYGRGAANALTQFVDQCRRLDGFLNATVNDLMAVSDFSAAVKIADRLVETDNTTPQHYFIRGQAREGAHDYENALADYMQIALVPDVSHVTRSLLIRAAYMHAKAGRHCEAISMIRMWTSAEPGRANNPEANQQIVAYAAHQSCLPSCASGDDTCVRQAGKTIRVKALVNGMRATFIVDTGATYVMLARTFAQRAHVPRGTAICPPSRASLPRLSRGSLQAKREYAAAGFRIKGRARSTRRGMQRDGALAPRARRPFPVCQSKLHRLNWVGWCGATRAVTGSCHAWDTPRRGSRTA
jgi:hypothetical protein